MYCPVRLSLPGCPVRPSRLGAGLLSAGQSCASSKVILVAESARLSCSNVMSLDEDDLAMNLELYNVAQLIPQASAPKVEHRQLPCLSEQDAELSMSSEQDSE